MIVIVNKYKRYIPIAAVVLIALGVNLDQFGIDLQALSKGEGIQTSRTSSSNNNGSPKLSLPDSSAKTRSQSSYKKWTDTSPNINQLHIFAGEINRSGKPVGFHSRPGGVDPDTARIRQVKNQPNKAGVYTASIEIRDGNQWKEKFSSFFPDFLSREEVIAAVLNAYKNSNDPKAQPFEGPSGLGFAIQGYTSGKGGINTAFPIYVRKQ